jgi:NAD(P)-dependent dehydrogenase (short-subunit alcohol dehydrogenase family)
MTTVLITGATRGIGLATARLLADRGWTVLLGARDEVRGKEVEADLRASGADATAITLEVTDPVSIERAAAAVRARGGLDVLVNNAGIVRADGPGRPSDTTVPTLREVFETNVFGAVAVTNAVLPLLLEAPAGRIVNVSSEVGSIAVMSDPDGPLAELTSVPYPASKAALNMVTAMYAKELRGTRVKVNAANPGYCRTDLNHNTGFLTPEQGAAASVHLATLPDDGPTGVLWGYRWSPGGADHGVLPW